MPRGLHVDLSELEARLARFDAKVKASREQLGIDFGAAAEGPAGGGGKGAGKACGGGHIAAPLKCHKGGGRDAGAPAAAAASTFSAEEAVALTVMANKSLKSDKARREEMIRLGVRPDTDFVELVGRAREKLGGPDWGKPHSGWAEKLQRFAEAAGSGAAQAPHPKRIGATPKPKKPEEEMMTSADVKTSADQIRFAKQQRAAAYRAGDKEGEKAWEEIQRDTQRRRLAAAMEAKQQTQTGLFGATDLDETLPLFGRRDALDPVAGLLNQALGESLPGAAVLNWDRHPRGVVAGRVAAEGLVYRFRCDASSIAYRPAWDGLDERGWEARSEGFLSARDPGYRQDFRFEQKRSKKRCSKGYGCGASCINLEKECRITPSSAISKQRLRQLQALATEGDVRAKEISQRVQAGRSQKAGELQEGRKVGKLKKLLEDPRVAEMVRTGKVPTAAAEEEGGDLAGKVKVVAPGEIQVDPERFQYKINSNASGEVGSLKGVKKWDDNLAGVISVWQDPADGQTYVVNGHNRLGLAKRMAVEGVTVRYLRAGSAKEARAIGAMQNIAEGQGTEIDAAKFFRDTGIKDQAAVEEKGLPLSSGKAATGLGLARLPEEMFREVVNGDLTPARGAIIGSSGLDEAKQREIGKLLRTRKGISDGTLGEYVEALAVSQRQKQQSLDLFGAKEETVDDGLARADLVNHIARKIAKERRLFGMVSQSKAAATLAEKAGNVINKEESADVASEADQLGRMFKDLKNMAGPMSDAINASAARVTKGESREKVQRELYEGIVEAMKEELERAGLGPKKPSNEAPTSSLFDSIEARLDAAKKCIKGLACGNSCIPKGRKCRSKVAPSAAGRLQQLQAAAGSEPPAANAEKAEPAPAEAKPSGPKAAPAADQPKRGFRATVAAAGKAMADAFLKAIGKGGQEKPAAAPAAAEQGPAAKPAPVAPAAKKPRPAAKAAPKGPLGKWEWEEFSNDRDYEREFTTELKRPVKVGGESHSRIAFLVTTEPTTYGSKQKRLLKEAGFDPPDGAGDPVELSFQIGVGWEGLDSGGYDRLEFDDPRVAKRLALEISRQVKARIADLPDGTIVAAGYHKKDGQGEARKKLYSAAGFAFYDQDPNDFAPNGFAIVQGGKLQRFPGGRKDSAEDGAEIDLDALVAQLLMAGGGDRTDAAGDGQRCGRSHIAPGLTCRQGEVAEEDDDALLAGLDQFIEEANAATKRAEETLQTTGTAAMKMADLELQMKHGSRALKVQERYQRRISKALDDLERGDSRLDALEARLDAAKKCLKGISCGSTCIPKTKTCQAKGNPAALGRLQELQAAAPGAPAAKAQPPSPAAVSPKAKTAAARKQPKINTKKSSELNQPFQADKYKTATKGAVARYCQDGYVAIKRKQAQRMADAGMKVDSHGQRLAGGTSTASDKTIDLLERHIARTPKYDGEVLRGIRLDSNEAALQLIEELSGGNVLTASMESWSAKNDAPVIPFLDAPMKFSGRAEALHIVPYFSVVLRQANKYGASIVAGSHLKSEREVLQPAGIRYKVLSFTEKRVPIGKGWRTLKGKKVPYEAIEYDVEVEAIGYEPMPRKVVMDSGALQVAARLGRLDARAGRGFPGHFDARGLQAGQDFLSGAPLRLRGPGGTGQDHRIGKAVFHGGDQRADSEGQGRIQQSYSCSLDALINRIARLDARRKASDPGQMDLFGGGSAGGSSPASGDGDGKPCGESHIAADLTCHKGGGGATVETPASAPASTNPRKGAQGVKESGDYEFARASEVQNAGEDLALSARHKRNMFRDLQSEEAAGTAEKNLTRDNLLKAKPHDLISGMTPVNTLTSLQGYLALQAFPGRPYSDKELAGYQRAMEQQSRPGMQPNAVSPEGLRKQYHDAFQEFHALVHSQQGEADPRVARAALQKWVSSKIDQIRQTGPGGAYSIGGSKDPFNPVANSLVDLSRRIGRRGTTSIGGRMEDFARRLKATMGEFGEGGDALGKAQEFATRIMEGASFNEAFGTVGAGQKKRFSAAELYVAPARRQGGRAVGGSTVEQGTDFILKKSGFRGLQYGNSVTDDERRHHLKKAAEALADLADVTGLPDHAMGLNGTLGLAIGARGRGQALAHFEPGLKVINLTRKRGVGTLSHEWGHALDNYLGLAAGVPSSSAPNRETISEGYVFLSHAGRWGDSTEPTPIRAAMKAVRDAQAESGFLEQVDRELRSMRRGGTAFSPDYWRSREEMFARSFEAHIHHKLAVAGRENTYLTQTPNHPLWPSSEQSEAMAPAFDRLLEEARRAHFAGPARRDSREVRVGRFMEAIESASRSPLERLEERLARLDARIKSGPGQMDLFGSGGGGPGTGKPCGEGHIAAPLKCHKGEGAGAPPAAPAAGSKKEIDSPRASEERAKGGLKFSRYQAGAHPTFSYKFRDRDAAEHWYAKSNASDETDIEVGATNRRGKAWQEAYASNYATTRRMLADAGDDELLEIISSHASVGHSSRGGTATKVRIGEPAPPNPGGAPRRVIPSAKDRAAAVAAQEKSIREVESEQRRQKAEGIDWEREMPISDGDLESMRLAKEIIAGRLDPREQMARRKAKRAG